MMSVFDCSKDVFANTLHYDLDVSDIVMTNCACAFFHSRLNPCDTEFSSSDSVIPKLELHIDIYIYMYVYICIYATCL